MVSMRSYQWWRSLLIAFMATGGGNNRFVGYQTWAVSSSSAIDDEVAAATVTLKREIETLQEQVEQYEMKHETLEAATDTFRLKAKNLKTKLEEERLRYDRVLNEKTSLEEDMDEKIEIAVAKSTRAFEEYKDEQARKQESLRTMTVMLQDQLSQITEERSAFESAMNDKLEEERHKYSQLEEEKASVVNEMEKEIISLTSRLRDVESQASSLDQSLERALAGGKEKEQKHEKELRHYVQLADEKASVEKELQSEITMLTSRLHDVELQSSLMEKSLKAALADEKEKDQQYQKERRQHVEESSRSEARIEELSSENKRLSSVIHKKDGDLFQASSDIAKRERKIQTLQDREAEKDATLLAHLEQLELMEKKKFELDQDLLALEEELLGSKASETQLQQAADMLSSQLNETKSELAQAKEALFEVETLSVELNNVNKENARIRQQLEFARDELSDSEKNSLQCAEAIEGVMSDYEAMDKDLKTTQRQLLSGRSLLEKCEQELALSQNQTKHLQQELDVANSRNREVCSNQTEVCNSELEEFKTRYHDMEIVALRRKQDLADSNNKKLQLVEELSSKTEQLDQTSVELKELRTYYSKMVTMSQKEATRIVEVEKRNRELAVDLATAREALARAPQKFEITTNDPPATWWTHAQAFMKWLDRALYQLLRVVLRIPGFLIHDFPKTIGPMAHDVSQSVQNIHIGFLSIPGLIRGVHDSLVTSLESMATAASDSASDDDESHRGGWICWLASFVRGHSQLLTVFGEAFLLLLCVDFAISSMIRPRPKMKPLKAAKISVPPTVDSSLLRKAKTSWN